jgi:CDP-glucose 4,6-dehydratase
MKVLLTGHSGFIGGWLCAAGLKHGLELTCVDRRPSSLNPLLDQLNVEQMQFTEYGTCLRKLEDVVELINRTQPEVIIHAAAQALIPVAFRAPYETFLDNSLATLNIFEAIRLTGQPTKIIAITSDKVYENYNDGRLFQESDTLGGKDIYSVTKSNIENLARTYAKTHSANSDLKIHTVRLGNVVGGADWNKDRLMPDIIRSALQSKEFHLRMLGAERPFQHIKDVVTGIFNIMHHIITPDALNYDNWNLGPKNNSYLAVETVIKIAKQLIGEFHVQLPGIDAKEDKLLRVSVEKYSQKFGQPQFTAEEAIRQTLLWYQQNQNNPFTIDNYDQVIHETR